MNDRSWKARLVLRVILNALSAGVLVLFAFWIAVVVAALLLPDSVATVLVVWSVPVAILLSLAAAIVAGRGTAALAVERQRRQSFHCVECGYDLRASTGRCPECGRDMR